jgi:hypothetical protein
MAQKLRISTLNQIADNWAGGRRHPWDWAIGNWTSFLGGRNQGHLNDPSKSKGVGSQFRLQVLACHHRCMMMCRYFYIRLAAVFWGGASPLCNTCVGCANTEEWSILQTGGVCLFVADVRSERDAAKKTVFGTQQVDEIKAWLKVEKS